jgi:CO/xanthine dehydrogenase Mo-binding subunit
VKVLRMVAAHDVGKAINPMLVEGQIEGGIAQGLGLALMEGVGEPGLVPTAPAILGAAHHATGVRATRVPLLPHRLREANLAREKAR